MNTSYNPLPETEQNENGELSQRQKYFLLKWFFVHIANVFPMTLVSLATFQVHIILGLALSTITVGFTIYIMREYFLDLYYALPMRVVGQITKLKRRTRGPTHYLVRVCDIEIRVPKKIWRDMEEERSLIIYFASNTKWILSYKYLIDS